MILLAVICYFFVFKAPAGLSAPKLSAESGFYESEFMLEITSEENAGIYYSLDGSDPSVHGVLYTGPIFVYDKSMEPTVYRSWPTNHFAWEYETDANLVDRCFTVRAVAIDANGGKSDISTGVYFIGKQGYDGMVLSIIAEPEDLVGDNGIIVTGKEYDDWVLSGEEGDEPAANFLKRGRDWEVPCTMDLFDGRQYVSEQKAGLRVQGDSSRYYFLRRFSVFARPEYDGSDYFSMDFFGDESKVHSVLLRTGTANAVFPKLVTDRDALGIRSVPVTVFLNGEYWYDAWLGEKYSDYYFNSHFGIARDNLISVKDGELEEGNKEDQKLYSSLLAYIDSHDLGRQEDYEGLCEMLDIQSYIDYCCINLYAVNVDGDDKTNSYIWRTRTREPACEYADGKWRFALYDMDALDWVEPEDFGASTAAEINSFTAQPPDTTMVPFDQNELFAALRENPEFCRQFEDTFEDIIDKDFAMQKVEPVLKDAGLDEEYKDSFFINRPEYMKKYLTEEFGD